MRMTTLFRATAVLLVLTLCAAPAVWAAGVTGLDATLRDRAVERDGAPVAASCAGGACGPGASPSGGSSILAASCGGGGCGPLGGFLQGIVGFFKNLFSGIIGFFKNLFGGGGGITGGGDIPITGGGDTPITGGGDTGTTPPGGDTGTTTPGGDSGTTTGTTPGGDTGTTTPGGSTPTAVAPPADMADLAKQAGLIDYPKTKNYSGSKSSMLNDIESHIALKHGTTYRDSSQSTWAHETTHGINSDIRNGVARQKLGGHKVNGFYLGDGKAYIMKEFNLRKRDAAPFIPASLRNSRYNMYVVGQTAWDDTPSYIFDEWVSYTNGGITSVELGKQGLLRQNTDGVKGALEFTFYSLGLAMAVERREPARLDPQMKAFMAHEMRRAMHTFREGQKIAALQGFGQQELLQKFLTSADGEAMRAFVKRHWGEAFFQEVFAAR